MHILLKVICFIVAVSYLCCLFILPIYPWASYQIRKIANKVTCKYYNVKGHPTRSLIFQWSNHDRHPFMVSNWRKCIFWKCRQQMSNILFITKFLNFNGSASDCIRIDTPSLFSPPAKHTSFINCHATKQFIDCGSLSIANSPLRVVITFATDLTRPR